MYGTCVELNVHQRKNQPNTEAAVSLLTLRLIEGVTREKFDHGNYSRSRPEKPLTLLGIPNRQTETPVFTNFLLGE